MQQPPTDKEKELKIYYVTQVAVKPPTFVVFVNDKNLMHFSLHQISGEPYPRNVWVPRYSSQIHYEGAKGRLVMMIVARIIALLIGYGFGLFQTGYLYGKSKGIDIRQQGSGNAGTTNSLRCLDGKPALLHLPVIF